MAAYKHILVAVDVCDNFNPLLDKATELAGGNAKISVIHVVEPVYYPENYMGGLVVDVHQKSIDFAVEELSPVKADFSIDDDNIHVVTGRHATAIHEFAEDSDVDLIIVGSHGKHGLQLLLGSTASAVLHGAKSDVLAIRVED